MTESAALNKRMQKDARRFIAELGLSAEEISLREWLALAFKIGFQHGAAAAEKHAPPLRSMKATRQ